MEERVEKIQNILKKYGQEHILNHYETLDDIHQKELLHKIEKIDFELISQL